VIIVWRVFLAIAEDGLNPFGVYGFC
jgi:hypothetical protein